MIVRVIEVSLRGLPILFFCCFVFFLFTSSDKPAQRRSSTFFYFFNSFNLKKSMSIVTAFPGIDVSVVYPLSFLLSRKVLVPGSLQFISSRLLYRLPCHYRFKHLMLLIIQLEYQGPRRGRGWQGRGPTTFFAPLPPLFALKEK